MTHPLISVIMPVYNGGKYLREAVESILNQTYTDFECIIINDGSTDNTEEILLSYKDPRIVYVKNRENLQIVQTLNKGIEIAQGKYIARMDADDISLPHRFETQIKFMTENPEVDICGSWIKTFGDQSGLLQKPTTDEVIQATHLFHTALAHPTIIMKKSIFDTHRYDEQFNKSEDYGLWASLSGSCTFANIAEPLLLYRYHDNQTDTELQKKSVNKVRTQLLKDLDLTSEDFQKQHELISSYEEQDVTKVIRHMKILEKANNTHHIYEQKSLRIAIEKILEENANTKQQLSIFLLLLSRYRAAVFRKSWRKFRGYFMI